MVITKNAGLKKIKVEVGAFFDPPAEGAFITFSGPTVGEYNDLMAAQMAMAKEDPNGIEVEVMAEPGSTTSTRKIKVSTDSAKKRVDLFNALIRTHLRSQSGPSVEREDVQ